MCVSMRDGQEMVICHHPLIATESDPTTEEKNLPSNAPPHTPVPVGNILINVLLTLLNTDRQFTSRAHS